VLSLIFGWPTSGGGELVGFQRGHEVKVAVVVSYVMDFAPCRWKAGAIRLMKVLIGAGGASAKAPVPYAGICRHIT
jgi:hypothetical protein